MLCCYTTKWSINMYLHKSSLEFKPTSTSISHGLPPSLLRRVPPPKSKPRWHPLIPEHPHHWYPCHSVRETLCRTSYHPNLPHMPYPHPSLSPGVRPNRHPHPPKLPQMCPYIPPAHLMMSASLSASPFFGSTILQTLLKDQ